MKNTYRFSLFIVALIVFSFSGEAQFRIYDLQDMRDVQHNTYGDPIINNNTSVIINNPQTETVPFEFDINFTNINELFRLEAQRLAAAKREYARWLTAQRDVLLKEINKQLGKNHTNFNTAKNEFFHDYEKNRRRVESAASTASWKLSQKAKVLNEQQRAFTSELYGVKEWQTLSSWCNGQSSGLCDQLSSIKVRGTTLGSTNTTSLNQLYNNSLNDFSSREFQSAQNLAWSKGVRRIIDDKSLLNIMVNNHIKYFDGLDSETQVYLMINYLSGFYSSQSPMIYQIRLPHPKYTIPAFWGDGRTIVEMGKKRAYLSRDALLFQPDYISYIENQPICDPPEGQDLWAGNPYCDEYIDSLYARREEIIQRHIDELDEESFIEYLKSENPIKSPQTSRAELMKEINRHNDFIRTHGYPEIGKYFDEVIPTLPSFSNDELYSLYKFMYDYTYEVQKGILYAVLGATFESFQLVIEYALLEVGGIVTLKLLGKLPVVIRTIETMEVVQRLKIMTNSLNSFKYANKYGFKTYLQHDKFFKALKINRSKLGVEIHHLFEQRFAAKFGLNPNNMKSIVLTVDEHRIFTNAWSKKIPYTTKFSNPNSLHTATATKAQIEAAAREIYKNYPEILKALGL